VARQHPDTWIAAFDSFYRAGALIFGGGHVVLPLLHAEIVQPGWVDHEAFLAGYGAAQALPGPLVSFAAFLGAAMDPAPGGAVVAAALCLVAIFAPSFLLVIGCLPWWDRIRRLERMQRAAMGVNAAVVGILLAALYDPVWTSAVHGPADFALVIAAWLLLVLWKLPPWLVVGLCAAGGALSAAAGL
jgi:chromate transporter